MKLFALLSMLIAAAGFSARADIPADWSTNYPAALAAAGTTHQPILVYFTASWCGPCKLMSRITLTDPAVVPVIAGAEHVGVDIDEHPDLAARHHVSAVPTFVLLSATEAEVARTTGFLAAADFLHWLTNSLTHAKEEETRQALARESLVQVDRLLASAETNSLALAATKLFDLCDARDSTLVQAAADRLKIIVNRDAAVLLAGMNDPRLATRLQVANVLRAKIGEAFDVDPWSDGASRAQTVSDWREKLGK